MRASGSSLPLALLRHGLCGSAALLAFGVAAPAVAQKSVPGDEARRRGGSAQDIQARMLAGLRERFGVVNDDEWAVISERLLKLTELRRSMAGPAGGARGGPPGGDPRMAARGGRPGGTPEAAALQVAVNDKLPDAEIKVRLAQLRKTRKENETKLEQAQEDFRAVLTIRQEAVAVLLGLLP